MQPDLNLFSAAVLTPLVGATVAGLGGRLMGDTLAKAVTILCMGVATLCAIGALWGGWLAGFGHSTVHLAQWVHAGGFDATWTLRFDALSVTMVAMVLVVSLLVHCYSLGYMSHDSMPTYRFFLIFPCSPLPCSCWFLPMI